MIVFPKEIVIATLRNFFKQDSFYHYSSDAFGFANTPDSTDLPVDAGLHDEVTTRLFIGEQYRQDVVFYPALIVKHGGANYVPISMNRERDSVQYEPRVYQDGYGNIKTFNNPASFIFAGAWEGSINIDIYSRSLRARDDLAQLVSILFADLEFRNLEKAGLVIKGVSAGGGNESDDRNDKLFRQTITLNVRSEWRRLIPIGNVIEILNFALDFGRLDVPNTPAAPNIAIKTTYTLIEALAKLGG